MIWENTFAVTMNSVNLHLLVDDSELVNPSELNKVVPNK